MNIDCLSVIFGHCYVMPSVVSVVARCCLHMHWPLLTLREFHILSIV